MIPMSPPFLLAVDPPEHPILGVAELEAFAHDQTHDRSRYRHSSGWRGPLPAMPVDHDHPSDAEPAPGDEGQAALQSDAEVGVQFPPGTARPLKRATDRFVGVHGLV